MPHDLLHRRDMHGGRKGIVRGLAHVDVIVRMHRRLAAELSAKQLDRAVRDHLVQVHVRLGARAGLPDDQREVIVELAVDHLARGAGDRAGPAAIEQAEPLVGFRRGELDDAHRAHERLRHSFSADAEILPRALGLRAPVAVGRHLDRTERVGLGAHRLARLGLGACCHDERPSPEALHVGQFRRDGERQQAGKG